MSVAYGGMWYGSCQRKFSAGAPRVQMTKFLGQERALLLFLGQDPGLVIVEDGWRHSFMCSGWMERARQGNDCA